MPSSVKLARASGGITVAVDRVTGQRFSLGETVDGVSDAVVKRLRSLEDCKFEVHKQEPTGRRGGNTAEGGEN